MYVLARAVLRVVLIAFVRRDVAAAEFLLTNCVQHDFRVK
jgi:hypothetical protein